MQQLLPQHSPKIGGTMEKKLQRQNVTGTDYRMRRVAAIDFLAEKTKNLTSTQNAIIA